MLRYLPYALLIMLGTGTALFANAQIADASDSIYGPLAPTQRIEMVIPHYKCNRRDFNLLFVVILTPDGTPPAVIPRAALDRSPNLRQQIYMLMLRSQAKGHTMSRVNKNHPDCQEI